MNIGKVQSDKILKIYYSRPFKVRNADEYDLENILDLFIDPTQGLNNPFYFENSIIKGRMGSGKTMYLRANHAYYLYTLVASIIDESSLVLPVYIRLSDFQHISDPIQIYNAFIVKIIEELSSIYISLQSATRLAQIHNGVMNLPQNIMITDSKLSSLFSELKKLTAQEYIQKIQKELGFEGKTKPQFFEASAYYKKTEAVEIKEKRTPGISDVQIAYEKLLKSSNGKIILLIDEAGSINKSFFKETDQPSMFEILMNQLRTCEFIRTKIAIYPQSYSDILTETRYGDVVNLQEDITDEQGYLSFTNRAVSLIEKYISKAIDEPTNLNDIFDDNDKEDEGYVLEQIINASSGNMRRFVQLLDLSMIEAFNENQGKGKANVNHALSALKQHALSMERLFNDLDKEFLSSLVTTCRSRATYKFQFPNKAPILWKFISKSSEYNILSILESGTGRRGTIYSFDYAFCVYNEIPTHYIKDTERIDKTRSRKRGNWIEKVTKISEELIKHASLPGKLEGDIIWINNDRGFLKGEDGNEYYWSRSNVIADDESKPIIHGKRVRFYPIKLEDVFMARDIEII